MNSKLEIPILGMKENSSQSITRTLNFHLFVRSLKKIYERTGKIYILIFYERTNKRINSTNVRGVFAYDITINELCNALIRVKSLKKTVKISKEFIHFFSLDPPSPNHLKFGQEC